MHFPDLEPLVGEPVASITRLSGGKNSRSCKVVLVSGATLVAKWYPSLADDPRDRIGTEFDGFTFLRRHGLHMVPRPLDLDRKQRLALYEFVPGSQLAADDAMAHLDAFSDFAAKLRRLHHAHPGEWTRPASDASLSSRCLDRQISARLSIVESFKTHEPCAAELRAFLIDHFVPAFRTIRRTALGAMEAAGTPTVLPHAELTLSPSDFGFHNAIRHANGEIIFVDFEYFGLDDPAKLVADFLLHPGMQIDASAKQRFFSSMLRSFGTRDFRRRFPAIYLLAGLKWCMILLNEFSPAGLARRRLATTTNLEITSVRMAQLGKARAMLTLLMDHHRSFPYDLDNGMQDDAQT
ncbi:aminoglycoside phosphotransferase family protein [Desulfovibrio sp. TomC]|uniref:aminoglycoside phosphotransferase family protein n=1 Tax=Desulfovibrio sp. TomC TaxID=1562888 RepID=UPI00064D2C69|nr:aminoglycoside phosphotransferase family protein [Desulfovibrio sp. TomC]